MNGSYDMNAVEEILGSLEESASMAKQILERGSISGGELSQIREEIRSDLALADVALRRCEAIYAKLPPLEPDELNDLGVPSVWQRIGREIGTDKLVTLWRALSLHAESAEGALKHHVYVPQYSRYQRHLRNSEIVRLSTEGRSAGEIQQLLRATMKVSLHVDSINRILRKAHSRSGAASADRA